MVWLDVDTATKSAKPITARCSPPPQQPMGGSRRTTLKAQPLGREVSTAAFMLAAATR
jgi:hypothetical protein